MAAQILVVEDNPITRKVFRITLQTAGCNVLEAEDAATAVHLAAENSPDLILLDLLLPDADGVDLARRIRAARDGDSIAIIACSGYLTGLEQARASQAGFVDFLFKPVEPSRLLQVVGAHLGPAEGTGPSSYAGRRVLIADDSPIERKLLKVHLQQLGFTVATAEDGADALDQARRDPPDAIVSDVLMSHLDGFRLCVEVRADPRLQTIPVILTSSAFTEEADRRLGEQAGADAFVLRTPDHRAEINALLASLDHVEPARTSSSTEWDTERYTHRIIRQLERQAALNLDLTRRLAWSEAQLSVLAGLTLTLADESDRAALAGDLLHRCLDASGVSKGAAFWLEPDGGLVLKAHVGYAEGDARSLADLFGHAALLLRAVEDRSPVVVDAGALDDATTAHLVRRAGGRSLLLVPVVGGELVLGILMLVFSGAVIEHEQIAFAQTMAGHVGQAVELSSALLRLRESEAQLATILNTIPDGIVVFDTQGRIQLANAAYARLHRLPKTDLEGAAYNDGRWGVTRVDGQPLPDEARSFVRVMRDGQPVRESERIIKRPDGGQIVVSVNAAPLHDPSGALAGVVASLNDVTQCKRTERALREANETLGAIIAASPLAIYVLDPEGRVRSWNPAAERMFGWSAVEVIGRVNPALTPEAREDVLQRRTKVLAGGMFSGVEEQRVHKNGSRLDVSLSVALLRDVAGAITGIIVLAEDISDRKRVEQALRESEQKYRTLVEQASDGISVDDGEGNYVDVNTRFCELLGYSREELLRLNVQDVIAPEDLAQCPIQFEDIRASKTLVIERWLRRKDGTLVQTEVSARALPDGTIQAIVRDITRRKRAERALQESEQKYRTLVEQASDGISLADPEGNYLDVNTRLCEMLGCSREEALRLNVRDIVPAEEQPQIPLHFEAYRLGETVVAERRLRRKDGTLIQTEVSARALPDGTVQAIIRDITRRKQAEEALRVTGERLQAIIQSAPVAIISLDLKHRVRSWNPAAERIFGWPEQEVLDRRLPLVPDDAVDQFRAVWKRLLKQETVTDFEIEPMRHDGSRVCGSLNTAPLYDAAGNFSGVMSVFADLTARKQAEAERQRLLEEMSRLEAKRELDQLKGDFVSTVSHEFRTPLASILGFSELLLTRQVTEEQQQQWVGIIHSESKRLAGLVAEVLDVSRIEAGRVETRVQPVRVEEAVGRVLSALEGQSLAHRIVPEHPDDLPPVLADPDKLLQVLTNLVSNAVKYSPDGGTVRITAAPGGDKVRLSVSDEGLGIPPEELPRLFGRFHRVRTPDRAMVPGTGLGLYITKHLVELLGGRIWVESPGVGMGSTFHVELPRAA